MTPLVIACLAKHGFPRRAAALGRALAALVSAPCYRPNLHALLEAGLLDHAHIGTLVQ
jgi:hypothetical protein